MAFTIKQACEQARLLLEPVSESACRDVEIFLSSILNVDRAYLYTWPEKILTDETYQQLTDYVSRRAQGEPMAYILGVREFWSLSLKVTPATLIPRPETECLISSVLDHYPRHSHLKLADLGTGSGAIALALSYERPHWQILAT